MPCLILLSLATVGLLSCRSAAGMIAASDFSVNVEGWRLSGDVTSAIPTYIPAGGNPRQSNCEHFLISGKETRIPLTR
jgi:hypothetical protein